MESEEKFQWEVVPFSAKFWNSMLFHKSLFKVEGKYQYRYEICYFVGYSMELELVNLKYVNYFRSAQNCASGCDWLLLDRIHPLLHSIFSDLLHLWNNNKLSQAYPSQALTMAHGYLHFKYLMRSKEQYRLINSGSTRRSSLKWRRLAFNILNIQLNL